jgi:Fe-S oxidoreductase
VQRSFRNKAFSFYTRAEIIVAPSASCTGSIKNYYQKVFADDSAMLYFT